MKNAQINMDTKSVVVANIRCGDCRHLSLEALAVDSQAKAKGTTCNTVGKKDDSKACPSFRKNIYKLQNLPDDQHSAVETLAKIARKIPAENIAAVGIALLNERETREQGFYFFQRVYVRYRGRSNRNYLGNFMACHVLYATKSHVVFCDSNGKSVLTFQLKALSGTSSNKDWYTTKEFKKLRKEMERLGHYEDSEVIIPVKKIPAELDSVVPSKSSLKGDVARIDEIYKKSKKNDKAKRKQTGRATLADVARSVINGEIIGNAPHDIESFGGLHLDDPYARKSDHDEDDQYEDDFGGDYSSSDKQEHYMMTEDDLGNQMIEC